MDIFPTKWKQLGMKSINCLLTFIFAKFEYIWVDLNIMHICTNLNNFEMFIARRSSEHNPYLCNKIGGGVLLTSTGSPLIAWFFGSMRNPCYRKFVLWEELLTSYIYTVKYIKVCCKTVLYKGCTFLWEEFIFFKKLCYREIRAMRGHAMRGLPVCVLTSTFKAKR